MTHYVQPQCIHSTLVFWWLNGHHFDSMTSITVGDVTTSRHVTKLYQGNYTMHIFFLYYTANNTHHSSSSLRDRCHIIQIKATVCCKLNYSRVAFPSYIKTPINKNLILSSHYNIIFIITYYKSKQYFYFFYFLC